MTTFWCNILNFVGKKESSSAKSTVEATVKKTAGQKAEEDETKVKTKEENLNKEKEKLEVPTKDDEAKVDDSSEKFIEKKPQVSIAETWSRLKIRKS